MIATTTSPLNSYLKADAPIYWHEDIPSMPIQPLSEAIAGNSYDFGHPDWASAYFAARHRDEAFHLRWCAAVGNWDGKIVVDVGCGPGKSFATVGGSQMARKVGKFPYFMMPRICRYCRYKYFLHH